MASYSSYHVEEEQEEVAVEEVARETATEADALMMSMAKSSIKNDELSPLIGDQTVIEGEREYE